MKTIFFNRVFWQHQAFWLGVVTFVSIWGLWLVCPPAVVAGNQALCQQTTILIHWASTSIC